MSPAKALKIVAYVRVSTAKQGESGLGLEAQEAAIESYAASRPGARVVATYREVETGKADDRPQLAQALHLAKVTGATLVIAKLDRLSRNAAFLLTLRDSGVAFVAADMPDANNLTIGVLAVVAQAEREAISRRTKEALAAAKRRGRKLGNPNGARALRRAGRGNADAITSIKANADAHAKNLESVVRDIRASGKASLKAIAGELNAREMQTPRGGRWHASSVANLLRRLSNAERAEERGGANNVVARAFV